MNPNHLRRKCNKSSPNLPKQVRRIFVSRGHLGFLFVLLENRKIFIHSLDSPNQNRLGELLFRADTWVFFSFLLENRTTFIHPFIHVQSVENFGTRTRRNENMRKATDVETKTRKTLKTFDMNYIK